MNKDKRCELCKDNRVAVNDTIISNQYCKYCLERIKTELSKDGFVIELNLDSDSDESECDCFCLKL